MMQRGVRNGMTFQLIKPLLRVPVQKGKGRQQTNNRSVDFGRNLLNHHLIYDKTDSKRSQSREVFTKQQQATQINPELPNNKYYRSVPNRQHDILAARKESHLNTCINIRKNKMRLIGQENKQLYKRIDSQKSLYSSTDFNKSFESISSLKRGITSSKMSKRKAGSSKALMDEKSLWKRKKQQKVEIKTANINNAKQQELQIFRSLFGRKEKDNNKKSDIKTGVMFSETNIRKGQSCKCNPVLDLSEEDKDQGGLLHRIAQQMFQKAGIAQKRAKKYDREAAAFHRAFLLKRKIDN